MLLSIPHAQVAESGTFAMEAILIVIVAGIVAMIITMIISSNHDYN